MMHDALCDIQIYGISLNWAIINEVTTRNTTAYFFGPPSVSLNSIK